MFSGRECSRSPKLLVIKRLQLSCGGKLTRSPNSRVKVFGQHHVCSLILLVVAKSWRISSMWLGYCSGCTTVSLLVRNSDWSWTEYLGRRAFYPAKARSYTGLLVSCNHCSCGNMYSFIEAVQLSAFLPSPTYGSWIMYICQLRFRNSVSQS